MPALSEWEEKLNSILENQDAMGQIMALARSLTGEQGSRDSSADVGGEEEAAAPSELLGMLGQVDPELLRRGMGLLQGMRGEDDRGTALLTALRPFLREEKQGRLDRAIQVMQMTRLFRLAVGQKEAGDV